MPQFHASVEDLPEPAVSEGFSLKRWSQRKLAAAQAQQVVPQSPGPELALPSLDSLTFESDFTPFMRLGVHDPLRLDALRKLLRDPRFNVMDGLDVYIDDYSKADPIEPALVRTLVQARYLLEQPETPAVEAEDKPKQAGDLKDPSSRCALEDQQE